MIWPVFRKAYLQIAKFLSTGYPFRYVIISDGIQDKASGYSITPRRGGGKVLKELYILPVCMPHRQADSPPPVLMICSEGLDRLDRS